MGLCNDADTHPCTCCGALCDHTLPFHRRQTSTHLTLFLPAWLMKFQPPHMSWWQLDSAEVKRWTEPCFSVESSYWFIHCAVTYELRATPHLTWTSWRCWMFPSLWRNCNADRIFWNAEWQMCFQPSAQVPSIYVAYENESQHSLSVQTFKVSLNGFSLTSFAIHFLTAGQDQFSFLFLMN